MKKFLGRQLYKEFMGFGWIEIVVWDFMGSFTGRKLIWNSCIRFPSNTSWIDDFKAGKISKLYSKFYSVCNRKFPGTSTKTLIFKFRVSSFSMASGFQFFRQNSFHVAMFHGFLNNTQLPSNLKVKIFK